MIQYNILGDKGVVTDNKCIDDV